jgi:hypothetical protein
MVVENFKDRAYHNLIEYAYNKCDAIMFVFRQDNLNDLQKSVLEETKNTIYEKYKKDFIKKRKGLRVYYEEQYTKRSCYCACSM